MEYQQEVQGSTITAPGEQLNYIAGEITAIKENLGDLTGEVEKVYKKTNAFVVD